MRSTAYDKAIGAHLASRRVRLGRVLRPRRGRGTVAPVAEGRRPISSTRLQLSPDQPFVLNYLGYSLADMGHHLDEARQMIQSAAERRPNDGAITDSLGWVMFRQGHSQDAVKTLERAVELEPEDATINGHLGDAYWAVGRKIEAQYQWRRALTLNPTPDDAAKLEAKLNTGPCRRGSQRPVASRPHGIGALRNSRRRRSTCTCMSSGGGTTAIICSTAWWCSPGLATG